jgi:CBS domain-containing protein
MPKDRGARSEDFDVTKRTPVREVIAGVRSQPCRVRDDEDILVATERLAASPGVHTVAVVDRYERLVGIIPMRLLLDDLFLQVAPEEFLVDLKDSNVVEEFGRISRARTAKELMEEPAFVTMDDTAREAFARMHERKVEGLPIVDADMKVVGYLDRFQLLRLWLKRHRRAD